MLEGNAKCYTLEKKPLKEYRILNNYFKKLQYFELYLYTTGEYFGKFSSDPEEKLACFIRAETLCKVGIIDETDFNNLCSAFPKWAQKM